MQGIIFNALEEFVIETAGMALWNDVIEASRVSSAGVYTAGMAYDDEEIIALASTLCHKLGIPLSQGLNMFGEYLFTFLLTRGPIEIQEYNRSQTLLMDLERVIHSDVRRIHPHSYTPFFEYKEIDDSNGVLIYRSKRQLCFIAEGVIQGLAKHFNQSVQLTHTQCMHDHHAECIWNVSFKYE